MEMNGGQNMLSSYKFWACSSIATSVLLINFAPRYSLHQNYTWTAIAIFFLQWLVYGVYAVFIWPRFLSPLRNLPTVTEGASPIFGQWSTLVKEPSGMPLRRWLNNIPNDGLIRYLHLFNRERVLLTSPKALAEVLTTKSYDFHKPGLLRNGIGRVLGIGILFAEGDEHKLQRKQLAPAFSFRHIKQLYPLFWAKSQEMVQTLKRDELEGKPSDTMIEVGGWASRATLDIIGAGGLGQDFNALADPDNELNGVYRKIFSPSRGAQILGLMQFFLPFWFISNLPVKRNEDIAAASKVARDTSRRLVRQKKEKLEHKEKMDPDIISIALESGGFSEEELVDNMMTFLAAGHETTASAMIWAIYLMCRHPEVQKKLREEIHSHIDSLESKIDDNIIDGMPYLHAVCQEVLRVYSPVPLTLRVAAVNTSIQGQYVPKGTTIILAPWAVNYSKELWGEDVDDFKPERWTAPGQANSGGAESNYSFLTFLHGPRSCIGSKFALAELKCLLAAFVGKFEFKQTYPDEEIEIKGGITARPKNGMRVNVNVVEDW